MTKLLFGNKNTHTGFWKVNVHFATTKEAKLGSSSNANLEKCENNVLENNSNRNFIVHHSDVNVH